MTESTLIALAAAYALVGIGVGALVFRDEGTPGHGDLPYMALFTALCLVGWPIIGYHLIADAVKFR